ncbi:WASH complex subunit 3-like [Limulus polyphemus]|uniref:WASH complex subunit 3-like n=1 Tax=Limulus polyphemus TaxID=6850 RepID=A0ABM1BZZ1_LIMPO|nr:WASH complex subunit 3-like [Limulus polyphemus]
MDADGLPIVGPGVDYSKVRPIHQKRTLAFLNHFLIRTTSFLNHFATVCDEKLENLLTRIQKLESSMSILEAKLASIPGLENVTACTQPVENQNIETPVLQPPVEAPAEEPIAMTEKTVQPEKPVMTISQDPRFAKYFKMLNLGVPVAAVKHKIFMEGLDPNILDNPDAPAPTADQEENSDASSDTSSSFSD